MRRGRVWRGGEQAVIRLETTEGARYFTGLVLEISADESVILAVEAGHGLGEDGAGESAHDVPGPQGQRSIVYVQVPLSSLETGVPRAESARLIQAPVVSWRAALGRYHADELVPYHSAASDAEASSATPVVVQPEARPVVGQPLPMGLGLGSEQVAALLAALGQTPGAASSSQAAAAGGGGGREARRGRTGDQGGERPQRRRGRQATILDSTSSEGPSGDGSGASEGGAEGGADPLSALAGLLASQATANATGGAAPARATGGQPAAVRAPRTSAPWSTS